MWTHVDRKIGLLGMLQNAIKICSMIYDLGTLPYHLMVDKVNHFCSKISVYIKLKERKKT